MGKMAVEPGVRDNAVFAALADATRRSLLANLAEGSPRTATQLAQHYPISRQGVLKHLGILEEAGLVAGDRRGGERLYRLTPEPLTALEQWVKQINNRWDARLLRLTAFLENEVDGEQDATE